ncbi:hypothetical protein EVAR_82719_1 [Eumeta japonica]|uniref:Uncharacterized protein n=1 Tax=Eumeta variegata TaxID=151549 RepID=A0A4C1YFR6_EUMVA|nr:hypothetical protein EVAR_82719_1 [Eumeta japonica]
MVRGSSLGPPALPLLDPVERSCTQSHPPRSGGDDPHYTPRTWACCPRSECTVPQNRGNRKDQHRAHHCFRCLTIRSMRMVGQLLT